MMKVVFPSFIMMWMMMAGVTAAIVDATSASTSDPFGKDQIDFDFNNENVHYPEDDHQKYHSNQKHPLENKKSWELELERRRSRSNNNKEATASSQGQRRKLSSYVVVEDQADEDAPYTILHKKLKRHIPFPGGDTAHGMMIDAGSQGKKLFKKKKRGDFNEKVFFFYFVCFGSIICAQKKIFLMLPFSLLSYFCIYRNKITYL